MSDKQNDMFTRALEKTLSESEPDIDELTLAKIRAARKIAVDQAEKAGSTRWIVPAAAAASVLLAVTTVMYMQNTARQITRPEVALLEDIEILGNAESLELLEELEFYEWLDSQVDKQA